MHLKYFEGDENCHENAVNLENELQSITLPVQKIVLESIPSEFLRQGSTAPDKSPTKLQEVPPAHTLRSPPILLSACIFLNIASWCFYLNRETEAWHFELKSSFWMPLLFPFLTRGNSRTQWRPVPMAFARCAHCTFLCRYPELPYLPVLLRSSTVKYIPPALDGIDVLAVLVEWVSHRLLFPLWKEKQENQWHY